MRGKLREIDLGSVLKIGRLKCSGGRRKETLLGDGMEAVIADLQDGGLKSLRKY